MADASTVEYCLLNLQSACMTRGEWASWSQAIGSILAIVASAWLVYWQDRKAVARIKLENWNANRPAFESIVEILRRAETKLSGAVQFVANAGNSDADSSRIYKELELNYLVEELAAFDARTIVSASVRQNIPAAREALRSARQWLQMYLDHKLGDKAVVQQATVATIEQIHIAYRAFESEMNRIDAAVGTTE